MNIGRDVFVDAIPVEREGMGWKDVVRQEAEQAGGDACLIKR